MVVIVSTDYIGGAIMSIRQKSKISSAQLSHLFECNIEQLHRYENGQDLIPRDVLKKIIKYAARMDTVLGKE